MRKLIVTAFMAVVAVVAMAQVNMKNGYVVTNQGDTLRGMIDLRTNEQLSTRCTFQADGASNLQTYKPGDIECFRFTESGKYFVTRRLNVEGREQLYFAEFIVHGKLNLYCVVYRDEEHFFFEREDGQMAVLTNRSLNNMDAKDILQEKREQYGAVKLLLKDSNKASQGVAGENITRSKLIGIVRDYHNDTCTDGSSCVEYEYNTKADEVRFHIKAFGGFAYYSQEMTDQQHFEKENYPGSTYEFGIGLEIDLERVMKGLSVELGAAYTPKYKSTREIAEQGLPGDPTQSTIEKGIATIVLGGVKTFGQGKIQPLVRAGAFGAFHLNSKERVFTPYNHGESNLGWNSSTHLGVYLGAGAQMPLGKHFVRLHADWYKSLESYSKMMKWGITAEFGF